MNEQYAYPRGIAGFDPFVPITLIGLSLVIMFISQIANLSSQRKSLTDAREQWEKAFKESAPQHEQLLDQSRAVQAKLEAIVRDLLALAKAGDADARAVVEKYGIRENPAPASAPLLTP